MNRFIFNLFHIDQFKTDYVISTWFSTTPFENNIRYKNNKNRLYLQRSLPLVTSIKDRDYVNPQSTAIESYTIEVEKGKYYYNVQNMTGSPTLFKVTKEEVL